MGLLSGGVTLLPPPRPVHALLGAARANHPERGGTRSGAGTRRAAAVRRGQAGKKTSSVVMAMAGLSVR